MIKKETTYRLGCHTKLKTKKPNFHENCCEFIKSIQQYHIHYSNGYLYLCKSM